MYKELNMAFIALTALAAFALPASASAFNEPTLKEGGVVIAKGTKLTQTLAPGTEAVFWNTATTTKQVTCTGAKMTGDLKRNDSDLVEETIETVEFTGTGTNKHCVSPAGADVTITVTTPICIFSLFTMKEHEFEIEGSDCAVTNAPVNFIVDLGFEECEYETTGKIKGDFTTNSDEARLTVRDTEAGSGAKKIRGIFCPTSGVLAMSFNIFTDVAKHENATAITIVDTTPGLFP
jgi:hypothetical protein